MLCNQNIQKRKTHIVQEIPYAKICTFASKVSLLPLAGQFAHVCVWLNCSLDQPEAQTPVDLRSACKRELSPIRRVIKSFGAAQLEPLLAPLLAQRRRMNRQFARGANWRLNCLHAGGLRASCKAALKARAAERSVRDCIADF
jgi:hypothetical protein